MNEQPLAEEERSRILDQMEPEVERQLEERVRQELTEKVLDDFGHRTSDGENTVSAWDAIQSTNCSLVLGKPGAGKTTFLKHIVLKNLCASKERGKLPIFVALREFADSSYSQLVDFIVEEFDMCGFPMAADFVDHILKGKRKCVLLFDGLDEIPNEKQADVVRQIVRLARRFRQNQFVVSCRTANYRGQLEGFTEYEVTDFGPRQVAAFVRSWFTIVHAS